MSQIKTPAATLKFKTGGGWYKGEDGKDGRTPVKGVDYWTDEDKLEIINELEDMEEIHVGDEPGVESDALLWMSPDEEGLFDVENYYTKDETDAKIAEAALGGEDVDLSDYVKKTDIGSNTALGLVKTLANGASYGVNINDKGILNIVGANASDIASKSHAYKPLTPNNLDYAIEVGLTTNSRTLSAEKQAAAKAWLGITESAGDSGVAMEEVFVGPVAPTSASVKLWVDKSEEESNFALKSEIPDVSGFATKEEIPDVSEFATREEMTAAIDEAIDGIEIPSGGGGEAVSISEKDITNAVYKMSNGSQVDESGYRTFYHQRLVRQPGTDQTNITNIMDQCVVKFTNSNTWDDVFAALKAGCIVHVPNGDITFSYNDLWANGITVGKSWMGESSPSNFGFSGDFTAGSNYYYWLNGNTLNRAFTWYGNIIPNILNKFVYDFSGTGLNSKTIPEAIKELAILYSPNGTPYKLSVSDDGTLSAVQM